MARKKIALIGGGMIGGTLAHLAVRLLETLDRLGIDVSPQAIVRGLNNPGWPGRLDLRHLPDGRQALLDAAHNPAGAAALASYLEEWSPSPIPLVFAAMRDKDLDGMLRALLPVVGPIVATAATNERSAAPEQIAAHVRSIAPNHSLTTAGSAQAALEVAWRLSPRIVVAGSIFLVADVMRELGR